MWENSQTFHSTLYLGNKHHLHLSKDLGHVHSCALSHQVMIFQWGKCNLTIFVQHILPATFVGITLEEIERCTGILINRNNDSYQKCCLVVFFMTVSHKRQWSFSGSPQIHLNIKNGEKQMNVLCFYNWVLSIFFIPCATCFGPHFLFFICHAVTLYSHLSNTKTHKDNP